MNKECTYENSDGMQVSMYVGEHLDPEAVTRYVEDDLSESCAEQVELHVVDCEECRESVRLAWQLAAALNSLRNSVKPAFHERALDRWQWKKTLISEAKCGKLGEHISVSHAAAASLVMGSAPSIEAIPATGSYKLQHPRASKATRGADGQAQPAPDKWSLEAEGEYKISLTIGSDCSTVTAEFSGEGLGTFGPTVAVVPDDPDKEVLFDTARRTPEGDCLRAVFEGVPEGEFKILISNPMD